MSAPFPVAFWRLVHSPSNAVFPIAYATEAEAWRTAARLPFLHVPVPVDAKHPIDPDLVTFMMGL